MENVYLLNMFPDYVPPEELMMALSQAAIVAADIEPDTRSVSVAVHSPEYIPQRFLSTVETDVAALYGLHNLTITATHPKTELHKIEPEELMHLFVSRNSMARGVLAGAKWEWEEENLCIKLLGNGRSILDELIPQIQNQLRERFATPVTITVEAGNALEGKALMEAMESMRGSVMQKLPTQSFGQSRTEQKPSAQPAGDTF